MSEQFLKKSIIEAVISFLIGLIITFCSCLYIVLYIYTDKRNLTISVILLLLGLSMLGWAAYKVKVLGKIADADAVDNDLDLD